MCRYIVEAKSIVGLYIYRGIRKVEWKLMRFVCYDMFLEPNYKNSCVYDCYDNTV